MIKILDTTDVDECIEILKLNPKINPNNPLKEEFWKKFLTRYFDCEERCGIGFFDNGKLISWMGIAFHENKMRGRFWTVSFLHTSRLRKYYTFNVPELGLLAKATMEHAESKKYYQYYYAVGKHRSTVYEKQWMKNKYIMTGRYNLSDVDLVPAYTKPDSELYWKLMGQELKPYPILIKKRELKDEFKIEHKETT
jgi:hypothetical protein